MYINRFSIPDYTHLYHPLLRFCEMQENEAKEFGYLLNSANPDSIRYVMPHETVIESSPAIFFCALDKVKCRFCRTEVQLYKALTALNHNTAYDTLESSQ